RAEGAADDLAVDPRPEAARRLERVIDRADVQVQAQAAHLRPALRLEDDRRRARRRVLDVDRLLTDRRTDRQVLGEVALQPDVGTQRIEIEGIEALEPLVRVDPEPD